MYIETGGQRYPCTGAPSLEGDTLRLVLPEGGPELDGGPAGVLRLCMDDGFVMRELNVSGYLRWEMAGDTLVITNEPVPAPAPEPEPVESGMTTEDALVAEVVDLRYEVEKMKLGGN